MKENKIPSAKEFLKSKGYAKPSMIAIGGNDVIKLMIEFAKLHVKEALKASELEAYKFVDIDEEECYKPQIINSYLLTLIK